MKNRNVIKFVVGGLAAGATMVGLGMGSAPASAKIEPGHYVAQNLIYGFVPTPESNVKVAGNTYRSDYYGVGPQNLSTGIITPTRNGGILSGTGHPVDQWFAHVEYRKTKDGYYGTSYVYGQIPIGNVLLKDTDRRANQAH